jgi:hypothetical protein
LIWAVGLGSLAAMSMPKTGSRIITVDGVRNRWRVRPAGTYAQSLVSTGLTASVELADESGRVLVVEFDGPRPDNWFHADGRVALPRDVAQAIRDAVAAGYDPRSPGGPFFVKAATLPQVE